MSDNIWGKDLLNVKARGETFTKLIQSIDDSKVISIEAGFGRGKTFFREAWARHLCDAGEVVIEIDAQKSDHSGDPVVTFIGALVQALGPDEKTRTEKAKDAGLKYTGMIGRSVMKLLLRSGADEVIEELTGKLNEAAGDMETLNNVVDDLGDGMSTLAGQMIASQMAAEQARAEEMPEQLDALRKALTKDAATDRVVILIDELDRCHPEYAIALLEAMKLVFDRPGYVFVLMINAEQLERVAEQRFGKPENGEKYIEKFVDIPLSLGATGEVIGEATRALVMEKLDIVGVPFGEGPEFTVERAAEVGAQMAPLSGLSMRQIKRVLLKVEVALRCYREVPLDLPLLVWLAFEETIRPQSGSQDDKLWRILPRSGLNSRNLQEPDGSIPIAELHPTYAVGDVGYVIGENLFRYLGKQGQVPLEGLPLERYRVLDEQGNLSRSKLQFRATIGRFEKEEIGQLILDSLAPWYIQEHHEILEAVYLIGAAE